MKLLRKMLKEKKGFTLIELVIVIAVLAILMAMAVPSYQGFMERARVSNDNALNAVVEKSILFLVADGTIGNANTVTVKNTTSGGALDISVAADSGTTKKTALESLVKGSKNNYWQSQLYSTSGRVYTISGTAISVTP